MQRDHGVISTTLLGGRTVVHVYDDASPGPGFEATEPDLDDVYFSTMAGIAPPPERAARPGGMKLGRIFRFEFAYQLRRARDLAVLRRAVRRGVLIIQANYVDDARRRLIAQRAVGDRLHHRGRRPAVAVRRRLDRR